MTTYYGYDENGHLTSATMVSKCVTEETYTRLNTDGCAKRGDIVGEYLLHRTVNMSRQIFPGTLQNESAAGITISNSGIYEAVGTPCGNIANTIQGGAFGENAILETQTDPQSQFWPQNVTLINAHSHNAPSTPLEHYSNADLDVIRHHHPLHIFTSHIPPERKRNAISEPYLDVIEEGTGVILARAISKKLLVLFLGRKVVTKYLRTVGFAEKKPNGGCTIQELRLPNMESTPSALRILIAWMIRACRSATACNIMPFKIPQHTFTACMLAKTCELLELHNDALRVEITITRNHFYRPIFAVELHALWSRLEWDSKFTLAAIKVVGSRMREVERVGQEKDALWMEMDQLMEREPLLGRMVRDVVGGAASPPPFPVVGYPYGWRGDVIGD